MIKGHSITLVIPCRNEEKALRQMLRRIPKFIDEVLVIDNNSSDSTRKVARELGAKVFTEKRTHHGIGYGYAHQKGLAKATRDIVVTMDGDNTYPVKDIRKLVTHLITNDLDFVSGNRFPLHNDVAISKIRQLGVWVLNTEVKLLYNYPIQDILSGMWAVRREKAPLLQLQEGGWNLSPEIKLAALMHPEIKFGEFHIDHEYRYNGESKQQIWITGFEHLFYILERRCTVDSVMYQSARQLSTKLFRFVEPEYNS